MSSNDKPIRIKLYVDTMWVGAGTDDFIEFSRKEWDNMSAQKRRSTLDEEAESFLANHVDYGWHILDVDDQEEFINQAISNRDD